MLMLAQRLRQIVAASWSLITDASRVHLNHRCNSHSTDCPDCLESPGTYQFGVPQRAVQHTLNIGPALHDLLFFGEQSWSILTRCRSQMSLHISSSFLAEWQLRHGQECPEQSRGLPPRNRRDRQRQQLLKHSDPPKTVLG